MGTTANVAGDKWNAGAKIFYNIDGEDKGMRMSQMHTTYECSKDVFSWIRADWKNHENNKGKSIFSVGSTWKQDKYTASAELFYGMPTTSEEGKVQPQEGIHG